MMYVGFCILILLHCMTSSERLSDFNVDADAMAMMQLLRHPSPAPVVSSLETTDVCEVQNPTPDQIASCIVNAIVTNAGLGPEQAQNIVSKLDVQSLADVLAGLLANSSATGDLESEIDLTLHLDPAEIIQAVTAWLDNASQVLANKGITAISTPSVLSAWFASAGQQKAKQGGAAEVVVLETGAHKGGYEHVMASFAQGIADANGTYVIRSAEQGGPMEVNVRVGANSLMGLFSSWLGDLAASFEEVGVRDASIRAGLGPDLGGEDTWEARHHSLVSLLGQKGQLSALSATTRESKEAALSMMRTVLGQLLQRSRAHAKSLGAADLEQL